MSIHVQPFDIFDYFENVVNYTKAQNLDVFSIAVILQYHSEMFNEHSKNYCCHCFKCRIYRLLAQTLVYKGYKNSLYISGNCSAIVLI